MYLFLDYDETLTSHDTLSLIPSPSPSSSSSEDFSTYTQAYLSDMRAHENSWQGERNTIRGQLRFLGSLAEVERKSVARVEKGGLFVDWRPQEAEKRGREEVRLRRGVLSSSLQTGEGVGAEAGESGGGSLEDFLRRTTTSASTSTLNSASNSAPRRVHAGILSVSWSTAFLRASLHPLPLQFIHANDPVLDPSTGLGTGKLNKGAAQGEKEGGIRTGLDKLRLMRQEMGKVEAQQRGRERGGREERERKRYSVYAGDSNTDLPCLLEASLGLILGEASSLLSTLERIGLRGRVLDGYEALQRWLEEGREGKQGGGGRLHPVDPARIHPWEEGEEERRAQDVCLVRVADWVEGTRVLELVLALEEGQSAQPDGNESAA